MAEYQNNIEALPKLSETKYENLFKVYQEDGYYIYNINSSLNFDKDLDEDFFYEWTLDKPLPWTTISYIHYDTIDLWWLLCLLNDIQNPVLFPEAGTILKIFKPIYVRRILDEISTNINE